MLFSKIFYARSAAVLNFSNNWYSSVAHILNCKRNPTNVHAFVAVHLLLFTVNNHDVSKVNSYKSNFDHKTMKNFEVLFIKRANTSYMDKK
eukprot:Awhi_evm1s13184